MMNDSFVQRVRAAAAAAWWTLLIGGLWLTVGWLIWLPMVHARPGWVLTLWGGGELDWPLVHRVILWFFGAFKAILFVWLLLTVWLTLWARRLKQA